MVLVQFLMACLRDNRVIVKRKSGLQFQNNEETRTLGKDIDNQTLFIGEKSFISIGMIFMKAKSPKSILFESLELHYIFLCAISATRYI